MATTEDFIAYVTAQIASAGRIRTRKMFGEYMVYVDEKPVLTVCDNTVFVKITGQSAALLPDAETGYPYEGAKECYILDLDDSEAATNIVRALADAMPLPKKKQ